jgi:hypothetical protein
MIMNKILNSGLERITPAQVLALFRKASRPRLSDRTQAGYLLKMFQADPHMLLRELRHFLNSKKTSERVAAAAALAGGWKKRKDTLRVEKLYLDLIGHERSIAVFEQVAHTLGGWGRPATLAFLRKLAKDSPRKAQIVVMAHTGGQGPTSVRYLQSQAASPNPIIREWVAFALNSAAKSQSVLRTLKRLSKDPIACVRCEAIRSLISLREYSAMPLLFAEMARDYSTACKVEKCFRKFIHSLWYTVWRHSRVNHIIIWTWVELSCQFDEAMERERKRSSPESRMGFDEKEGRDGRP